MTSNFPGIHTGHKAFKLINQANMVNSRKDLRGAIYSRPKLDKTVDLTSQRTDLSKDCTD